MREAWPFWRRFLNLAQPRLGAHIVAVSDDFFGAAQRMIEPQDPVFVPDKYDDHGKWMDGWESRRRRDNGHDWCIVRLGAPARLYGFDIATNHFNGNQPEAASIEVAVSNHDSEIDELHWQETLSRVRLGPDAQHLFELAQPAVATHLRLNIYPDGGVARLRAYGVVEQRWAALAGDEHIDLAAVGSGGCIAAASDEHFGIASNLLLPERGINMGDGWETARRRGDGHDWCVVALGCPGVIDQIEIDTAFFRGNFPHACSVEAGDFPAGTEPRGEDLDQWTPLLPQTKMEADHQHTFAIEADATFSHVRLAMYPDGGVSRLRVIGKPRPDSR